LRLRSANKTRELAQARDIAGRASRASTEALREAEEARRALAPLEASAREAWQAAQKAEDEAEKAKEAEARANARAGEVENALQHQEKLHREELDALRASHLVQLKEVRDGEFPDRPLGLIAFLASRHLTLGCPRSQG
jgi:uncharacterized coiled-coil DUF342 family protein